MGNKKDKNLLDRLADKIDTQGMRLELLVSVFYPDGVRAEFARAFQIVDYIRSVPTLQRFSEDEQTLEKCRKIMDEIRKANDNTGVVDSISTEIDLFFDEQKFRGIACSESDICIMFNVNPDDSPIYLQGTIITDALVPVFLVDGKTREAFLIVTDFDVRDNCYDIEHCLDKSSFIRLSELHAIVSGVSINDEKTEELSFMTSFSQKYGWSYVEEIYKANEPLLDKLFMYDESNEESDAPATCLDSQSEAILEVPEQLTTNNDCNDTPPPKKRGRPAKNKSNVKVEVETVIPSEPKPKASEMFELA